MTGDVRFRPKRERLESIELADVVPDDFGVGVEDMCAVHIHHHACRVVALGEAIAGDVRPALEYVNAMPGACKTPGDHCAGKAGTDDCEVGHCSRPDTGHTARALDARLLNA